MGLKIQIMLKKGKNITKTITILIIFIEKTTLSWILINTSCRNHTNTTKCKKSYCCRITDKGGEYTLFILIFVGRFTIAKKSRNLLPCCDIHSLLKLITVYI